jgi:predicted DNA-binding transcriptional regulator AlpA
MLTITKEILMQPTKFKPVASGRAIRLPTVSDLTGMSRATIWRKVKEDTGFPKPFHLSEAITAWDEAEILNWLASKKAEALDDAHGEDGQ